MANSLKEDENGICYIAEYKPYRMKDGTRNPDFNRFSGKVLDLKANKAEAIKYFYDILIEHITQDKNTLIVIVPSHDPETPSSGMLRLGKRLSQQGFDATNSLLRIKKIDKLTQGGTRSIAIHLKSIELNNADMIKDKNIILLDDVTTTGNSLLACKNILQKAGPKNITMIAIGKTQR
jgi:predicted amidophosphoribosyltransferase